MSAIVAVLMTISNAYCLNAAMAFLQHAQKASGGLGLICCSLAVQVLPPHCLKVHCMLHMLDACLVLLRFLLCRMSACVKHLQQGQQVSTAGGAKLCSLRYAMQSM